MAAATVTAEGQQSRTVRMQRPEPAPGPVLPQKAPNTYPPAAAEPDRRPAGGQPHNMAALGTALALQVRWRTIRPPIACGSRSARCCRPRTRRHRDSAAQVGVSGDGFARERSRRTGAAPASLPGAAASRQPSSSSMVRQRQAREYWLALLGRAPSPADRAQAVPGRGWPAISRPGPRACPAESAQDAIVQNLDRLLLAERDDTPGEQAKVVVPRLLEHAVLFVAQRRRQRHIPEREIFHFADEVADGVAMPKIPQRLLRLIPPVDHELILAADFGPWRRSRGLICQRSSTAPDRRRTRRA